MKCKKGFKQKNGRCVKSNGNGDVVVFSNVNYGGVGFIGALTLVFITVKLIGELDWSWLWVLSPIWISVILIFIFVLIFMSINKPRRRRK